MGRLRAAAATRIALLVVGVTCSDAPSAAQSERAEPLVEPARVSPTEGQPARETVPVEEPPQEAHDPRHVYESVVRVEHNQRLGEVLMNESWGPAERRQQAREICHLHFPDADRCPRDVTTAHANGVLEVRWLRPVTVRVRSTESKRRARRHALSLAGRAAVLLEVDGLDVSWLRAAEGRRNLWSGPATALVRRLRRAAGAGSSDDSHTCTLAAVTSHPDAPETFARREVGHSATSFGDACVRAAEALCDFDRCRVTLTSIDALPVRDHPVPRRPADIVPYL